MKMTFEIGKMPPLTEEQKKRLEALDALPDSKIDFTDMPPITKEQFARAVMNPYYRAKKVPVTIRMDSDVLAWLKRGGRGYQTRVNNMLKALMLKEMSKA